MVCWATNHKPVNMNIITHQLDYVNLAQPWVHILKFFNISEYEYMEVRLRNYPVQYLSYDSAGSNMAISVT